MVVKGINFRSLAFAGFAAGYLMFFVDKWFAGTLGLLGAFPGTKDPWWMLEHHIDGIILALAFAWPLVYKHLPGPGWLKGAIFGFVWMIVYWVVTAIAGVLGASIFAGISWTFGLLVTFFFLHTLYGFSLGVLYVPPESVRGGQSA
jgi:hypothetical protein